MKAIKNPPQPLTWWQMMTAVACGIVLGACWLWAIYGAMMWLAK
jgi:hypothetical protein